MGRRAALVTQSDITRAVRALEAAGVTVARVVFRPDGVSIETTRIDPPVNDEKRQDQADESREIIL